MAEEVGDYFPEFLDMLEESPFLKVSRMKKAGMILFRIHPIVNRCSVVGFSLLAYWVLEVV